MFESIVVIPTFNEAENIARMAASLFDLKNEHLGLLVVDDASPDGTGQIADQLVHQFPGRVNVIRP